MWAIWVSVHEGYEGGCTHVGHVGECTCGLCVNIWDAVGIHIWAVWVEMHMWVVWVHAKQWVGRVHVKMWAEWVHVLMWAWWSHVQMLDEWLHVHVWTVTLCSQKAASVCRHHILYDMHSLVKCANHFRCKHQYTCTNVTG